MRSGSEFDVQLRTKKQLQIWLVEMNYLLLIKVINSSSNINNNNKQLLFILLVYFLGGLNCYLGLYQIC